MDWIKLKKELKDKLGITYLLPHQELVVTHIAVNEENNKETKLLAVLPTGSGKSICFLAPLIFIKGVVLCIYPLLSLMADQERRMKAMNIPAATLKGGMDRNEKEKIIEALIKGKYKVLITNIEMLLSLIKHPRYAPLWKMISTIVIDEVHTTVTWGDTFRPSYKELPEVIKKINPRHILAFTATLDDTMYATIQDRVFLGEKPYIVKASSDRNNIFYHSVHTLKMEDDLLRLLRNKAYRPSVVFCPSREETERIAFFLCKHGIKCLFYHAGLDKERRKAIEDKFSYSTQYVLSATNAYGMGVDKKDIRSVIHIYLPQKADEFLQESGRCGRDGEEAHSFVLWKSTEQSELKDIFSSGKCIRNALLKKMGEETEHDECGLCSACTSDGFVPSGEKEILKETNRHIFRTRKNVIKRLKKKSLFNPFPSLCTWSEKEIERGIDEMVSSFDIKIKGDIMVLTKRGKKRLLQLQT